MASEVESDLRDTVDWSRKCLVDFNAGKTQLILFDGSSNTGAINMKMDGSVLDKKSSFKMLGLLCIFINVPHAHAWNAVVTSGLVPLLFATWNC